MKIKSPGREYMSGEYIKTNNRTDNIDYRLSEYLLIRQCFITCT